MQLYTQLFITLDLSYYINNIVIEQCYTMKLRVKFDITQ